MPAQEVDPCALLRCHALRLNKRIGSCQTFVAANVDAMAVGRFIASIVMPNTLNRSPLHTVATSV